MNQEDIRLHKLFRCANNEKLMKRLYMNGTISITKDSISHWHKERVKIHLYNKMYKMKNRNDKVIGKTLYKLYEKYKFRINECLLNGKHSFVTKESIKAKYRINKYKENEK